ncbi:MAG: phosphatase PAP2 family protein [Cytophagia bacterium]|nr:MAG: phosphatase PAP2 family protein [Runella sp.]TAG22221.1 MAG: phosphatase PAP2 family protein [Cytophagales bacterium]TAG41310.1 MAG: phosphatase PAP2 family protein [Cytophagia bacterium]TAG75236.1 MAG: phosphatase PAP2 family protein [Runella slithyformis]TAG82992.1 MAG: phosphatase PAP2 family protein [Cytophagales bacterium]
MANFQIKTVFMHLRIYAFTIYAFATHTFTTHAFNPDSLSQRSSVAKQFVVPVVLLGAGAATLNERTKQWQTDWHARQFAGFKTKIDDGLQFAPNLAWFGLSLAGVEGRHKQRDQIMLGALSNALGFTLMYSAKHAFAISRPDGTSLAFPSGHTTNAFVGAAMLHKEYGSRSVWYSLAGYSLATSVGFLRMANNEHWLSDVLAGAGTGILATEITYAVYPWLKRTIFKNEKMALLPTYNGQVVALSFVSQF